MTSESSAVKDLFTLLDEPVSEFVHILSAQPETIINIIPFKNSWTIAQVADLVTKSTVSIGKALNMESTETQRDPGERIEELKKQFLDFTVKFKSPEFILPTQNVYETEDLVDRFNNAFKQLKARSHNVNLTGMISHPAFGDVTKLELLYFVLYHTKRHLRQVKNILSVVSDK